MQTNWFARQPSGFWRTAEKNEPAVVHAPVGRNVKVEIQDAVISPERLVLVVGPNAALSDYVWGEWQFGLEACRIRESNTTSTRPYRRSAQAILSFGYRIEFAAGDFMT